MFMKALGEGKAHTSTEQMDLVSVHAMLRECVCVCEVPYEDRTCEVPYEGCIDGPEAASLQQHSQRAALYIS